MSAAHCTESCVVLCVLTQSCVGLQHYKLLCSSCSVFDIQRNRVSGNLIILCGWRFLHDWCFCSAFFLNTTEHLKSSRNYSCLLTDLDYCCHLNKVRGREKVPPKLCYTCAGSKIVQSHLPVCQSENKDCSLKSGIRNQKGLWRSSNPFIHTIQEPLLQHP